MEETGKEMEIYKIGVIAVKEIRWKGEWRIDKKS